MTYTQVFNRDLNTLERRRWLAEMQRNMARLRAWQFRRLDAER